MRLRGDLFLRMLREVIAEAGRPEGKCADRAPARFDPGHRAVGRVEDQTSFPPVASWVGTRPTPNASTGRLLAESSATTVSGRAVTRFAGSLPVRVSTLAAIAATTTRSSYRNEPTGMFPGERERRPT
jgi:hypothetical protein